MKAVAAGLLILAVSIAVRAQEQGTLSNDVTVTVLTTNTADTGAGAQQGVTQGEWSFSAWVEVGDRAFLFDTGWSPNNVLMNAEKLGIDLSLAEDLILSHHHGDHTGGLETLRRELTRNNPAALSRIHVARGIFGSRPLPDGSTTNTPCGSHRTAYPFPGRPRAAPWCRPRCGPGRTARPATGRVR